MPKYWFDSWRRYFTKNHGRAYALTAGCAWLTGALLYKLHRFVLRRPNSMSPNVVSNFLAYCITPIVWSGTNDEKK